MKKAGNPGKQDPGMETLGGTLLTHGVYACASGHCVIAYLLYNRCVTGWTASEYQMMTEYETTRLLVSCS